jgi:hypothetical protein
MQKTRYLKGGSSKIMAIDQFTDELNIKELFIPEPMQKPELLFVPARDIPPEKWEKLKGDVNGRIANEKGELVPAYLKNIFFDDHLANALILFPERKNELEIPTFDQMLSDEYSLTSEYMKIIFPSISVEDINSRINGSTFDAWKNELLSERGNVVHWLNIGEAPVFGSFILYPDRFDELREISGLSETFEAVARNYKERSNWGGFAEFKLAIKLLGESPQISESDWEEMRKTIGDEDSFGWDLAAAMKMLEAQEIKMTSTGLRVIMPGGDNLSQDANPVPESRKF